ncbi:MAG: hypothetical protein ACYC9M_10215 [Desulfobulbaceae bacterium]
MKKPTKKIIVLAKPVTPKKIAAVAACCKTGPARTATTDGK